MSAFTITSKAQTTRHKKAALLAAFLGRSNFDFSIQDRKPTKLSFFFLIPFLEIPMMLASLGIPFKCFLQLHSLVIPFKCSLQLHSLGISFKGSVQLHVPIQGEKREVYMQTV